MSDRKDVDLTIRRAGIADAAALADLMTQLGYPTSASEMKMRMEAICANDSYATFVALSGNEVCGMVGTITRYTYEHNSPSAMILALVVSREMRGRGVGQALITAVEKDLLERDVHRMAVNARFERIEAHAFYEKLGFTKNGFRLVKELQPPTD